MTKKKNNTINKKKTLKFKIIKTNNKKKKNEMNIKNTLKISYDMINFTNKKQKKKKTKMSDFFDNVKDNKKINLPNVDEIDFDINTDREKSLFNRLLKQEHFNTATSYQFKNKW
tara:strand:- start:529 stop:870 length:342 start_codon:yes stop_codon:yes gene_type:complete